MSPVAIRLMVKSHRIRVDRNGSDRDKDINLISCSTVLPLPKHDPSISFLLRVDTNKYATCIIYFDIKANKYS